MLNKIAECWIQGQKGSFLIDIVLSKNYSTKLTIFPVTQTTKVVQLLGQVNIDFSLI